MRPKLLWMEPYDLVSDVWSASTNFAPASIRPAQSIPHRMDSPRRPLLRHRRAPRERLPAWVSISCFPLLLLCCTPTACSLVWTTLMLTLGCSFLWWLNLAIDHSARKDFRFTKLDIFSAQWVLVVVPPAIITSCLDASNYTIMATINAYCTFFLTQFLGFIGCLFPWHYKLLLHRL